MLENRFDGLLFLQILKRASTPSQQQQENVQQQAAAVAAASEQQSSEEEQLWVEKYKPRKYIELLSDEATNRSLLYWLKMWDKTVFGRCVRGIG